MSSISKDEKNLAEIQISEDVFQKMRDLNEKLLAIDYAKEFVPNYKCPPIHRYYFCKQINQAQQFFTFCCLNSYLINKLNNNGHNSLIIDSFDDPNLTIEKILKAAQQHIDVSQHASTRQKLRQGYGLEVITLLNSLIDKFWVEQQKKNYGDSDLPRKIEIVIRSSDGSKVDLDEDEDDTENDQENEIELEEEFEDYLETESDLVVQDDEWQDDSLENQANGDQQGMIVAKTDLTEWKLELERILPKMNTRFMNQDTLKDRLYESEWRIHLQAARRHHSNIENIFEQTSGMLRDIITEIKTSLDKIRSKENYLQQNSNTILAEWINVRERALTLKQTLDQSAMELKDKSLCLQQLNEEDKETKQSIEEFSLKITDSSPLLEAKKARQTLKQELTRVNLQIGVAIQILVRYVSLHSSYAS